MKRLILIASIMMLAAGAYAQTEVGSVTFQPKVGKAHGDSGEHFYK